ncbi:MAG: SPOR domain-containing protein [Gracilimonas sp.]|uniref:SPOR domain-containing protein n=1 Tax=Gracilimonas sp. TaxID=1974203 RepID=UPI0019CAEFFF|nr:SPOR domain-containing protein [Gracilimonas sp.]MBD3615482.1 SPOR domain-containing protein [Gracilimonas sp.]
MLKSWLTSISSLLVIVVLCLGFQSTALQAQNNNSNDIEVYLDFRHRGIINSVVISYYKNDEFFLPVSELFSLFQIDHTVNGLVIDGKFGVEQISYQINFETNRIRFGDTSIPLTTDDYLIKEIDSYLRADVFHEAFGLDFTIDFNNLSLNLETERELPAVEQAIRNQRRRLADENRFQQERYELRYDRERPFLDGGFVDYNLSANMNSNQNVYNFNTNLGLQVYGGDLQGSIFGSYSENFTNFATNNLRWRYMYRDQPWLTKLTIGQTTTDGFARNAYTGVRLSNEPIEPRRLFDEFEVQGNTIPQSEVELYLNNALIDFQQADELGNYRFLTPITYGSSQLDLKIYGPTGQIIERSNRIQVPFTFQPSGVFNYTINAGKLDNPIFGETSQDLTAQGTGAYGITDWLTAKVGVEYYQGYHESLPTFTSSLSSRIMTNYILTLEAATDVYYRGLLNVIYPNSASFSFDYTDFTEGFSIYNPSNDDKRMVASIFYPFNFGGLPFNLRASTFSRIRPNASSTTFRVDANSRIGKLNLRLGYSDRYVGRVDLLNPTNIAYLETSATYNITRNRNLPVYLRGAFLRGQARYQPTFNRFESAEILISQNVFDQGQLQLSFGRNFTGNYNSLRFSLIVDFNKVRTSSTYSNIRSSGNFTQNVRGSIGYDTNYNNTIFTSREQVGRSGTAIQLYVDNNSNGIFDNDDQTIEENAVRVQRSGATSVLKNGVLYLTQMQPYFYYNMELNKSVIKNPMLVPEFEKFGLITDPNRFKKVEIPFYMSGVIEGLVAQQLLNGDTRGVAGLRVLLTQTNGDFDKEMRTFSDGSFYNYEVPPGRYRVEVDSSQLDILQSKSIPESIEFEVEPIAEGDFVEGLQILLVPANLDPEQLQQITEAEETPDTPEQVIESPQTEAIADTELPDSTDQGQVTETVAPDSIAAVDPETITQALTDTTQITEAERDETTPRQTAEDSDDTPIDPPVIVIPSIPVPTITLPALTDVQPDSAELVSPDSLEDLTLAPDSSVVDSSFITQEENIPGDIDSLIAEDKTEALQDSLQLAKLNTLPEDSVILIEQDTTQTLAFAQDSTVADTSIASPADEPIAIAESDTTQIIETEEDLDETDQRQDDEDPEVPPSDPPIITIPAIPVPNITPPVLTEARLDSSLLTDPDFTENITLSPDSSVVDSVTMVHDEPITENIPTGADSVITENETDPAITDTVKTIDPDPIKDTIADSTQIVAADQKQGIDDPKDVPEGNITITPPAVPIPSVPDSVADKQAAITRPGPLEFESVPKVFSSTADIEELSPGRCIYGIQFASYFTEARANILSKQIEDNYLTFIIYNEPYQLHAVREIRYQSLNNAGSAAKKINSDDYFDAAVISQCYADLDFNPETPEYYIEIEQLSNPAEANQLIDKLNSSYGANAKLMSTNQQDLHIVALGPFDTKNQAARKLSGFSEVPDIANSVITRVSPPAKVINVSFEFMLLIKSFDTIEAANTYAQEIESRLGENLKVLIDENKSSFIVVSKTFESWSNIQNLKERYNNVDDFDDPVILMIEKKN